MYDFKRIEKKWQDRWEKSGEFRAKESKKNKYFLLEMLPYPSGLGLHMGHARNYTIGDVLARYKRLNGVSVLYPMSYDSFGLPAENAAIKEGIHPKKYTESSIKNFINQQKRLGLSYDWSRTFATHTKEYYKWDQWIFLQFLKNDMAYRKKALVNYCPKCRTVLANEQVVQGKCWRHSDTDVEIKELEQWFFRTTKYADELLKCIDELEWPRAIKDMQKNWIGESEGTLVDFRLKDTKEIIPVFTTRPDTLFGVTFITFAPEHPKVRGLVKGTEYEERIKEFIKRKLIDEKYNDNKEGMFIGRYAVNPLTNEEIPIYIANFVLSEYGTGVVMGVPAHDRRDYDFARKHDIPIIRVIAKDVPVKSYLMGASDITDDDLIKLNIKIVNKKDDGDREIEIPKQSLKSYEILVREKLTPGFWNEYVGKEIIFIFKHKNGRIERLVLNKKTEEKIDKLAAEFMDEKWGKSGVWRWLSENKFYTDLISHEDEGILVNSDKFSGVHSKEAINKINSYLEKNNLGKRTRQYKLRDWLISRQRYWGCPIPIIYCDKCGIVPEKNLPVVLPDKVDFKSGGNPLATSKSFVNAKCPKCRGKARRETDTMDTFVDSSWYLMRYCDPKNAKKLFDKRKINYWMPVDFYIGGREHATGHLIYFRFFTKVFRDFGLLDFDEPALRLYNQGDVNKGGIRMSKSKGNVVDPMEAVNKYGADSLRFYLMFVSSPDSVLEWDDTGMKSSFNFMNKLHSLKDIKYESSQKDRIIQSKINSLIMKVTEDIENIEYNKALISLMEFTNYFHRNGGLISRKIFEDVYNKLITLLNPFIPHLTSELNCSDKWPKGDNKLINRELEFSEEFLQDTIKDIHKIINLTNIKPRKINLSVSKKWKYDLFRKLKNEKSIEFNYLVKKYMIKEYSKEFISIIKSIVSNPKRIPEIILTQEREYQILNDYKNLIESEFSAQVEITKDDEKCYPGKVSIWLE